MQNGSWVTSFSQLKRIKFPIRSTTLVGGETEFRGLRLLARALLCWLILWVAWAVRLWHLDASNLTYDEAATYFVAYRPLPDILTYLRGAVREHPPVYYMLIRPWMALAGTSEYSLRFFAAGASLVGIAFVVRLADGLARKLGISGPLTRVVSTSLPALILALFPFEVYYARDARMYTLMNVWAVLSSLLFLPLLFDREREGTASGRVWPEPSILLGLVFINGLALFTHYYLLLLIVTQFATLLLLRRWRALLGWSVAHGLIGLGGLVWLAGAPGLASSLAEAWGRFAPVWPTVGQLRRLLADLLFGPVKGVPWNLVYLWGALVAFGLLVAWLRGVHTGRRLGDIRAEKGRPQVVAPWLTITTLMPLALAYLMPESPRSRYLIFVLPFAALAIGQIPFLLTGNKRVAVIWVGISALAISTLGIFGLPRTVKWIKSNYGHTIAIIAAYARPGDGVLFYGPWQNVQFYYYGPDEFPPVARVPDHAPPQLTPEEAEPALRRLLDSYERLWVIPASVNDVDPDHFVAGWLNTHAHPVWTTYDWSLYVPPAEQAAVSLPIQLRYGNGFRLERLTSDARAVPAGESLRFTLTWVVSDTLDNDVVLDFSLLDGRNARWRQWQSVPGQWLRPPSTWRAGDVITDRQGLIVPQGAPPGSYTVQLTVVDPDNGTPLRPLGDPNALHPSIDLVTFEVTEPTAPPVLEGIADFVGPFTFEAPEGAAYTLILSGYELGGLEFQQGYPIPLELHWLAPGQPVPDLTLRLQLQHRSRLGLFGSRGETLATETLPLIPGYPVGEWPSGRLVSLPTALPVPGDAPPGRVDLTLAVLGADDLPWTIAGEQRLTLGSVEIEERPMLRRLPKGLTVVQVDFVDLVGISGDKIGLRGYKIDGEARPGGRLSFTYGWYAISHPSRIYSVFNHLLTTDGQSVAQTDGWPQGGRVLTTQWRPGEYIEDNHTLEIPTDALPGPYLLAVGLYDAATAERLQVTHDGKALPNQQWLVPVPFESE